MKFFGGQLLPKKVEPTRLDERESARYKTLNLVFREASFYEF